MKYFEIDGKRVKVSVKPSDARKTIGIEFKSQEELVVSLPRNREVDVKALLEKHSSLITRKYRELLSKKRILDGDTILYQGKPFKIEVRETLASPENRVAFEGDSLIVQVQEKESPAIILKKWMTTQTKEFIQQVMDAYSERSEKPSRIFVQDTRRWGYCKKNGDIVFNWQLAALPEDLARYVVLHELTHLSELNHQRGFHQKMVELIPNYREKERELKNYIALEPNFQYKTKNSFGN